MTDRPKLYSDLASWWPLLSPPAEYAEEAEVYKRLLEATGAKPLRTMLELGSGGGNNASHLKAHFELTLADLSPDMQSVSRRLNPECEHVEGDMRALRLDRTFDAVFIHDAISYMTTEQDLAAALETAAVHCRPGGAVLVTADELRDTFESSTEHGGSDDGERGIRYLQWCHSPEPDGTTYLVDFAYLLREGEHVTVEHDRHVCGLFLRSTWLGLLRRAGFDVRSETHTFSDGFTTEIFVGTRL